MIDCARFEATHVVGTLRVLGVSKGANNVRSVEELGHVPILSTCLGPCVFFCLSKGA